MSTTSVRVYCRMRPFNKRELALGNLEHPIELQGNLVVIPSRKKQFDFDGCFGPDTSQEELFKVVGRAVIGDFMDGFNATQFVYGQTGSGKTWTMMGNDEHKGLIPRSVILIFEDINKSASECSFEIQGSYLEIYMEKVNDLLDPDKVNLDLKENKKEGVYVKDLSKEIVSSIDDVHNLLKRGDKVRKVATTKMNAGSSRSHSVLTLYLQKTNEVGVKTDAKLNLVDLAGSERADKTGATGEVLKQGNLINLSLTTLSQVIATLSKLSSTPGKKGVVVPFRNSKLTRLLQTSLGGNSKTALSIHLSPHEDNLDESISTLEFGKRAKQIKTKASREVKKTVDQLLEELARLKEEYAKLKQMILDLTGGKEPEGLFDEDEDEEEEEEEGGDGGGGGDGDQAHAEGDGAEGANGEADAEEPDVEINKDDHSMFAPQLEQKKKKKRGVSRAAYEKVVAVVKNLESEKAQKKREIETLTSQIAYLEDKLMGVQNKTSGLKKDIEIRDLEVQTIKQRMRTMTAERDAHRKSKKEEAQIMSKEIKDLRKLIAQQKELLKREGEENRDLKQENLDISDELTEKTRRLALAELQVMRYDSAQAQEQDQLRKRRKSMRPRKKPSDAWRDLVLKDESPSGLVTQRSRNVDYEKIRKDTVLERLGGLYPVPMEELTGGREGFLAERLYKAQGFVRHYFVIKDSFLLCYEGNESLLCEPMYAIPLNGSKVGSCPKQGDKEFCFMVLCGQYFNVLAATTESEKAVWLKDLNHAKFITHESLVSTACFNKRAVATINEANVQTEVQGHITKADYYDITDPVYALSVPVTGGMEGFLSTSGFQKVDVRRTVHGSFQPGEWQSRYCILRDSLLLVFDLARSHQTTEPIGAVLLGEGTDVVRIVEEGVEEDQGEGDDNEGDEEGEEEGEEKEKEQPKFYFTVVTTFHKHHYTNTFFTNSKEDRARWITAIKMGALVTVKNVMLAALHCERISVKGQINPKGQDEDLVGNPLPPGCMQPYDERGKPLFQHPDGRWLSKDLKPVSLGQERYSSQRQQLDLYNRPLPEGAVLMFAANPSEPLGVGMDGVHYAYPSGRELKNSDPHFDIKGAQLSEDAVKAANQVLSNLQIANIVASAVLSRERYPMFDAFGRALKLSRNGALVTQEGHHLPATAAVFDAFGNRKQFEVSDEHGEERELAIAYFANDGTKATIAKATVELGYTTLLGLHAELKKHMPDVCKSAKISVVVFLVNGAPVPESELEVRIASDYLPELVVSCRDIHGNRMAFDGEQVALKVDHEAADKQALKEKEAEFVKKVGIHKKKKKSLMPPP